MPSLPPKVKGVLALRVAIVLICCFVPFYLQTHLHPATSSLSAMPLLGAQFLYDVVEKCMDAHEIDVIPEEDICSEIPSASSEQSAALILHHRCK